MVQVNRVVGDEPHYWLHALRRQKYLPLIHILIIISLLSFHSKEAAGSQNVYFSLLLSAAEVTAQQRLILYRPSKANANETSIHCAMI